MRLALAFVLIALSPLARAADGDEPADLDVVWKALEGKVLSEKQLVPRGFLKNGEARGDLDGDGLEDIALIIHRDHHKLVRAPGEGALVQIILIFTAREPGKYEAWLANQYADWLLDNSDEDNEAGPFQIKKGVLTLGWGSPESGSYTGQNCTIKWRNGPAGFQLIGLTLADFDKRCACGSSTDTNYLTGLQIYETDQGKNGNQLKKPRTVKTRKKPQTILWENFDWDKTCSGE
jgi:hypothetical protein